MHPEKPADTLPSMRGQPTRRHRVHAIEDRGTRDLTFIRGAIEASGAFTCVSAPGLVAMGAIGFTAAGLAATPALRGSWLAVWLGAALLASSVGLAATVRRARTMGIDPWRGAARRYFGALLPPFVAAALLTVALVVTDRDAIVPALWLLLYGAGVAAAGASGTRATRALGIGFMFLGALALGEPAYSSALLAAGFGGLHVAFGIALWRRTDGD